MAESGNSFKGMTTALRSDLENIRSASTPEEAYQAFMDKLGEGFTQAFGDAIAEALDVLQEVKGEAEAESDADGTRNVDLIMRTLGNGSHASLQFSAPGIGIPSTKKVKSKGGVPSVTRLAGGSVGVTGTYEF